MFLFDKFLIWLPLSQFDVFFSQAYHNILIWMYICHDINQIVLPLDELGTNV